MGSPLFPEAYKKLIDEDIEWLEANAPESCERGHIIAILSESARDYDNEAYQKAMQGGT